MFSVLVQHYVAYTLYLTGTVWGNVGCRTPFGKISGRPEVGRRQWLNAGDTRSGMLTCSGGALHPAVDLLDARISKSETITDTEKLS